MKKATILSALAIALLTNDALSQGSVSFANSSANLVRLDADAAAALNLTAGSAVPAGNESGPFLASLFYAPGSDVEGNPLPDPGDAEMLDVMGPAANFITPGRFSGGIRLTPNTTQGGQNAWFQVRVWESAFGTNYEQAVNAPAQTVNGVIRYAIAGKSNRFSIPVGSPTGTPASIIGAMQGFSLSLVPGGPLFRINDIVISEGTNGTVNAVFTVSLLPFNATTNMFSVDFATVNGSALAGQDYVATNGTLHFNAGETQKLISVTVTADLPPEPEEDFFVNLSNPVNALIVKGQGRGVITEIRITELSVDVSVSFNTVANRNYVVEKSADFSMWMAVPGATNVLGTGSVVTILDRGAGCASQLMYRARLLP